MRIALYQHINSQRDPIIMEVNKYMEGSEDFVRVSEVLDADFKNLDDTPAAILAERKIAAAQKEFDAAQAKLNGLINE